VNVRKETAGISGEKTFKTVIVPKKAGSLTVPPIKYYFFDYSEKRYKTISTAPIELKVKQGVKEDRVLQTGITPAPEGVRLLGSDIRFIKQNARFKKLSMPLYRNPLIWFINLLPVMVFLGLSLFSLYNRKLKSDAAGIRASKAYSIALKEIKKAEKLIIAGKTDESCAVMENILHGYIAGKVNRQAAGLTKEEIIGILAKKAGPEIIKTADETIERCHYIRFAPSAERTADLKNFIEEIKELINTIERVKL
jgi:hypothetical protein